MKLSTPGHIQEHREAMQPTSCKNRIVVSMLVLVLVLAALDQTIVATALPTIAADLQGHGQLTWVFSTYLVASTAVIPLYGRLADAHGPRATLLFACLIFVAGSMLCGLSRDMSELLIARAVQGLGAGGLMTLTMLAIGDVVPPTRRGQFQGLLGSMYGLATLFGPPLGGWLTDQFSWRWAFLLNVPPGLIVLLVLAVLYRPAGRTRAGAVDYPGALLLAMALVTGLLATRARAEDGVHALLPIAAIGLLAAFVWLESKVANPILPLHLFRRSAFTLSSVLSASTRLALFTAVVFVPLHLQYSAKLGSAQAGLHLLPLMLAITAASVVGGKRMGRRGTARALAIAGSMAMAGAYVGLALSTASANREAMLLALGVLGLGIGLTIPVTTIACQRTAQSQDQGIATASVIMFRTVGGALGVSLLGALLAQGIQPPPGGFDSAEGFATAFSAALQPLFWVSALVCSIAGVAALGMPQALFPSRTHERLP
ncbi:DHA2 family efflux MFS transporter permease subunit [Verminephrobacter aporrectodeae subsp. tuberculatae]|nr:DHA2 family efflux MFS transporter permease subunit [Verminephrobacter aporrectodeae subsp. tuberculatae]